MKTFVTWQKGDRLLFAINRDKLDSIHHSQICILSTPNHISPVKKPGGLITIGK